MLSSSIFKMYQDTLEQSEPARAAVDDNLMSSVTTEAEIPAEREGSDSVSTAQVHLVGCYYIGTRYSLELHRYTW